MKRAGTSATRNAANDSQWENVALNASIGKLIPSGATCRKGGGGNDSKKAIRRQKDERTSVSPIKRNNDSDHPLETSTKTRNTGPRIFSNKFKMAANTRKGNKIIFANVLSSHLFHSNFLHARFMLESVTGPAFPFFQ